MTVSYYYDKSTAQAEGLGANVDPDNYVGGGLVVMSFNGTIIWSKALDRTTNKVTPPHPLHPPHPIPNQLTPPLHRCCIRRTSTRRRLSSTLTVPTARLRLL